MKRFFSIIIAGTLLVASLFQLQGCAVAAGLIACDAIDKSDKAQFAKVNTEREKSGLKPYTWEQWEHLQDSEEEKAEAKKDAAKKKSQSKKTESTQTKSSKS